MCTVAGGEGRSTIARLCRDRREAEHWAQELIKAGINPVTIDGVLVVPESAKGSSGSPDFR